jgi:hypothetical protein
MHWKNASLLFSYFTSNELSAYRKEEKYVLNIIELDFSIIKETIKMHWKDSSTLFCK